ncbi:MAG: peptidylprolyl isomerase [Phycisphaerae bacterium]
MKRFAFTACGVLVSCSSLFAGTIAHFDTSMGAFDVELYDSNTPITVANFLNYVNDGDYTSTFIHRSIPGFVVQGGGFGTDDTTDWFVPADAPILNEPGISNLRGTIAMAKLDGDPNSATSEWFINLEDNLSLDSQNGGFTVFGHVIGDGMNVVDAIAALQVYDASEIYGAFDNLPLTGPYFDTQHLVMVNSVTVPEPATLSLLALGALAMLRRRRA